MSVLKTKRRISSYEYWNSFTDLYKEHVKHVSAIASRKQRWVCTNINSIMRQAYISVSNIEAKYLAKETREDYRENLFLETIIHLESLQDGLLVLWNIEKYSLKQMTTWADMINNEMKLLNKYIKQKHKIKHIEILDWDKIHKVNFLRNMSNLHRYVHEKVIKVPRKYDETISSSLTELIDKAFVNVMLANTKIPETKDQYEHRKLLISEAISCLENSEFQLLQLFNIMNYSERIMMEFSEMLTEEIKMLKGLQISDRKRFADLK